MNPKDCNAKAAKPQSVLEDVIESLKSEVLAVNRLADRIFDMLRDPSPACENGCAKSSPNTVADSLRDIRTITEGTKEQLEGIARILEEQLGCLKLEH